MPTTIALIQRHMRREWWWFGAAWMALGVLAATGFWLNHRTTQASEAQKLMDRAIMLQDHIAQHFEAINHALEHLAATTASRPGPPGNAIDPAQRLLAYTKVLPLVRRISFLDAEGRAWASSHPLAGGTAFDEIKQLKAAGHDQPASLFISLPYYEPETGQSLVLARTIIAPSDEVGGTVVAEVNLKRVSALMQSLRHAPGILISLMHGSGAGIATSGKAGEPTALDLQPESLFSRHIESGLSASTRRGPLLAGVPTDYLAAFRTLELTGTSTPAPLVLSIAQEWHEAFAWEHDELWLALLVWVAGGVAAALVLRWLQQRTRELIVHQQLLAATRRTRDEMLQRLVENVPGAIYQYRLDPDGSSRFPYSSPGITEVYEHPPETLRIDAAPVFDRLHPGDAQRVSDSIRRSAETLAVWHDEYRVLLPQRGERWLKGFAKPQRLEDGAVLWHGYIYDMTDAKRQTVQIEATERTLRQLITEMPVALILVDADGRIYFRNQRFLDLFGYAEQEVSTLHDWALKVYPDPADRAQAAERWRQAGTATDSGHISPDTYRTVASDGSHRIVSIAGLRFSDKLMVTFQDQTSQQLQNELLYKMAYLDGLTGIANRRRFDERLEEEWSRCHRSQQPLAILMMDIDHFKAYNDLYGHQKGDECLQAVARALAAGAHRPYDLVARYGGEEFVCLLPLCDLASACEIGQTLLKTVQQLGLEHKGSKVADVVTISIGVACAVPTREQAAATLVQHADERLYNAKNAGRNRVNCSDEALPA